jgi:hypothetical protein
MGGRAQLSIGEGPWEGPTVYRGRAQLSMEGSSCLWGRAQLSIGGGPNCLWERPNCLWGRAQLSRERAQLSIGEGPSCL